MNLLLIRVFLEILFGEGGGGIVCLRGQILHEELLPWLLLVTIKCPSTLWPSVCMPDFNTAVNLNQPLGGY